MERAFSYQKPGLLCLSFAQCYLELGFTLKGLRAVSL